MPEKKISSKQLKLISYFFIPLLVTGLGILIYSFVVHGFTPLFTAMRQIGAGIGLIGIGEWINHPLQKTVTYDDGSDFSFHNIRHRRRNPSALGNLLEIAGLILIFTGLAPYF